MNSDIPGHLHLRQAAEDGIAGAVAASEGGRQSFGRSHRSPIMYRTNWWRGFVASTPSVSADMTEFVLRICPSRIHLPSSMSFESKLSSRPIIAVAARRTYCIRASADKNNPSPM